MTTLQVGRMSYKVEKVGTTYHLIGKRGADYMLMRNHHRPELMFVVGSSLRAPRHLDGLWLTDEGGALRVYSARGATAITETPEPHTKDSDCTVDPATDCCTVCGVDHGEPCPECEGRGFHNPGCSSYVPENHPEEQDARREA